MAFTKDILLIDFETTGSEPAITDPVEIAAILLDRETLAEKAAFSSLINCLPEKFEPWAAELWKADFEKIQAAPDISEVGRQFIAKFGFDVLPGSWVQRIDRAMLNKMMQAAGEDPEKYDYHWLDLWPIAYLYLLQRGYSGGLRSDEMFAQFGVPLRGKHEALEDCRIEAEILRKILNASPGRSAA